MIGQGIAYVLAVLLAISVAVVGPVLVLLVAVVIVSLQRAITLSRAIGSWWLLLLPASALVARHFLSSP